MKKLRVFTVKASPAAGGTGAATVYADSSDLIKGEIMGVYVNYLDSPPGATTDVTIATVGVEGPPVQAILTLSNQATSKMVYPRVQAQDTAGANIAGAYVPILVADRIRVTIAQANDGDGVEVSFYVQE